LIKESLLKFLNFKMKGDKRGGYWFELKHGDHLFITCDDLFNEGKDEWIIGYQNIKLDEEPYWFNNEIKTPTQFTRLFEAITNCMFSINGVHKEFTK